MYQGKTVFSQILSFVNKYEFGKCVSRYRGNYKIQSFSCWEHFIVMAFAQLTFRNSLRDIESCLHSGANINYHIGLRSKVSRSTLADANENRDWRIYFDLAQILIGEAVELYQDEGPGILLKNTIYALDSTTIDLCLSLFPWAKFRSKKGGIKLHTLLNLRGNIPVFIKITEAKINDMNILDDISPQRDEIIIMDRGYVDYRRLNKFNESMAFFVVRAKSNLKFSRISSDIKSKENGIKCDQVIRFKSPQARINYPDRVRRIKFFDYENKTHIVLLTNNFEIPAQTIADLYKHRWKVELFFKWIKQHLQIKKFYGNSEKAVKTQIWIAISTYVLISIIKKRLEIGLSMYHIMQVLSVTLFNKAPLNQLLTKYDGFGKGSDNYNQLILFDL